MHKSVWMYAYMYYVCRYTCMYQRTINESIYVRVNNPTLTSIIGKYNLPHILDRVLFTIPELEIGVQSAQHHTSACCIKKCCER